jgi:glycosyltransferase involved in cell wall biosynthesis
MMNIGVVIPLFKSEKTISELVDRLIQYFTLNSIDYNIVLVDDGCPNESISVVSNLTSINNKITSLKLSRNFGQHYAISAGLKYVKGDWIVVMDADLQDLPENIDKFINTAIHQNYDIVVGLRIHRQDNFLRKLESFIFYKVLNLMTGLNLNQGISNFGIYHRRVIDNYNLIGENFRSFGMFVVWLGYKRYELPINHGSRTVGKSSYTFKKKINLAIDTLLSFSDRPLKLIISLGLLIFSVAFCFLIIEILRISFFSKPLLGWTSLILMVSFCTALILVALGIVGLYVGKTFMESKKRPLYVIDKIINP